MIMGLVSIYIPTKNRLSLLRRAVESVLTQTVRNIELIVVSDGSDDGTAEYVESIDSDIRVRLINNPESKGACFARNQALAIAEGEFVTGLDDDDYFFKNRIEDFLQAWKYHESCGTEFGCLFDSCVIDDGHKKYVHNERAQVSYEQIRSQNFIGNQVFTKLERIRSVGAFDPRMPAWQDWELWVRLLETCGPAVNISRTTYFMDTSHEFERITHKSPEKILLAATLFFEKHCTSKDLPGILLSLGNYPGMKFTAGDLARMALHRQWRFVARNVLKRKTKLSLGSSITPAPAAKENEGISVASLWAMITCTGIAFFEESLSSTLVFF